MRYPRNVKLNILNVVTEWQTCRVQKYWYYDTMSCTHTRHKHWPRMAGGVVYPTLIRLSSYNPEGHQAGHAMQNDYQFVGI